MSCVWVAEIGSNHAGQLDRALALIHAAHEVGCDAVKFQLGRHDKLWAPEVRKSKEHLIPYELPLEWLPEIRKVCDELGLKFGCTPLYLEAVKELEPWVDFLKIASGEAEWIELVEACERTQKPIVYSMGLTDRPALALLTNATILHCVCEYPTKTEHADLERIGELKTQHSAFWKIGLSDHSVNPRVIERAVLHWKAEMVEFHLDYTPTFEKVSGEKVRTIPGPESGHSWQPHEIEPVIEMCKVDDGVWPGWEGERKWMRGEDGLRPTEEARCKDGLS